ncbi:MAG: hypothetical protein IKW10_07390 [Oscillospiraceae bacterium]|nr:hypothetical protein [Oscillospiraceae bacterium]
MDCFLAWLEKYDLLIELAITILTIILSLLAVFQTRSIAKRQLKQEKNIAKQQVDLQERQIRISVYEQKNEINKVLNTVFDTTAKLHLIINHTKIETLDQRRLYDLLHSFLEGVDVNNISYTLKQSRYFLNLEIYQNIKMARLCFSSMTTNIDCLDLLKEDEEVRQSVVDEVRSSCEEIKLLQASIETAMVEEMKLF